MTTVEELIDFLTQFPPQTAVVYDLHSEMTELRLDEIRFCPAASHAVIRRGETYITWSRAYGEPHGTGWEFATVLRFPGN